MRDWQLTADRPHAIRLAADARLGRTDYTDDQSWEIAFGGPEEPALAIQTRFGGRTGLARLVPMWVFDGRSVYEGSGFAERPMLRNLAPNFARITARPISNLMLMIEVWVMDSQAIGGRFVMKNEASQPMRFHLDLFAQVVREGEILDMNLLGLDDGSEALHLGRIGNLNPVLLLERSQPAATGEPHGGRVRPKLGVTLTIPAGEITALRWVHAGERLLNDSLQRAYYWLNRVNWEPQLRRIEEINARTPIVETGNPDWDAVIGFSNHVALRSFIGPTGSLPNPSYVTARIPARGFSRHNDGSDHGWQWNGQTAALGYLLLPSVAILAPDLARGAVRNALAVKQADGWIDFKPGLGGQRARLLSAPLWATIAWRIYEQTEDEAFIREVLPGLRQCFARWFYPDCDRDGDGFPEWANVVQAGYTSNPLFAQFRRWAQNADISKAEAPDLAALLIREGRSLLRMAELVGDSTDTEAIRARLEKLSAALDGMWHEAAGSYLYRDRDTDQAHKGIDLFRGKGDEAFDVKTPLDPPNRLILRIVGGKDTAPRASVVIEGLDARGNPVAETVPGSAFTWYYGLGAAVTEHVYSQIHYIRFEGVIRLYTLEVDTVDLTRQNLTQLLPLWAEVPDNARAAQIVKTLTDEARYWRPFGLPVCPANDPAFAADNDGGSGGVWLQWNTMLIEGLLDYGYTEEAATLVKRLLEAQLRALRRDHAFRGGYNSETGEGLGDIDEVDGTLPLSLFMRLIGLRIVNARRVWAGGPFTLPDPVTVAQFGVRVTRSASGTRVQFPSGHTVEADPAWQLIEDPTPEPEPAEEDPHATLRLKPDETMPEPEPVSRAEAKPPPEVDDAEAFRPSANDAVIPVASKKDETMEIPISKIDYTPSDESPDSEAPGTIRIPVRGPKREE